MFYKSMDIFPGIHTYISKGKCKKKCSFLSGRVRNGEGIRDKEKEKTYLEEGLQQVRDAFQNYDNVILTDESIWYCLCYLKKSLLCDLKKRQINKGIRSR